MFQGTLCFELIVHRRSAVADPGFPRGGDANSSGGGGVPTYDFAKFSQKQHEIERIWRGLPLMPLRSATDYHCKPIGVFPKWSTTFTEFSEFRESDKPLKHEMGSI